MRTTNTQIELPTNNHGRTVNQKEQWTYSSRVLKSWGDAKKAKCCTCFVYFILIVVGFGMLVYQYGVYLDENKNSVTRSEIKKIDDTLFPYLYIDTLWFDTIQLSGVLDGNEEYDLSNINRYDIKDFNYDETITQWSIVSDTNNTLQMIIVPPFGKKLKVGDSIAFQIKTSGTPVILPSNAKYEALLQHFTNGALYGLFWIADNVEKLQKNSMEDIFYGNTSGKYDKFEQYEFTFISTINFVQIDSFKRINNINPAKNNEYYEMTQKASMLMEYYFEMTPNNSVANYTTDFYFYYNPIGGGVQTVLTTDRLFGLDEIFSKTGGVFSPFKDGALLFLGWLLFGFPVIGCGIASKKGLDDDTKKRVKVYLEEIGLIDENKIKAIKHKEEDYKGGCCCC